MPVALPVEPVLDPPAAEPALEPPADEPVLDPPADAPVLLDAEPPDDTSVRMNPPRSELLLADDPPLDAEPDVPVALVSPERRQPVNVTDCPELELDPDPVCPVGDCPADWADTAAASAAENTVPNKN